MVELVLLDDLDRDQREPDEICATAADSQVHQPSSTKLASEPMLKPASRLADSIAYVATPLRRSPSEPQPSPTQPNRTLPLRPAPRRQSATLILCPPPKPDQPRKDAKVSDGETKDDTVSEKSESDHPKQSPSPKEKTRSPEPSSPPVRNGSAESTGSPRPRIVEDVLIFEGKKSEDKMDPVDVAPEDPKEADPKKKEEHQQPQQQQQQQSQHRLQQQQQQNQQSQNRSQQQHHQQPAQQQQPISSYCNIRSTERSVSNDCVEITIPSLPELGINESRTDRISINQESTPSSPFYLNYIVTKDSQCPSGIIPLRILPAVSLKNPDPGGQSSPNQNPNLRSKPAENQSSLSLPPIVNEESDCVLVIDEGKPKPPTTEQQEKQKLRDNFLEIRNKAVESQQRLIHSVRLLDEDHPQRSQYLEKISGWERQINYCNSRIAELSSENRQRNSPETDDAQLLGLTTSGAVEIRRVYGPPVSESQNFDKRPTEVPAKVTIPNVVEFTDAVNLNRKIQPQMNGFSPYNETSRGKSVTIERTSPRNYVFDTQNHPSKSVIVEPIPRSPTTSPSTSKTPVRYSSFLIDELSAAPAAAVQVRPYSVDSRDESVQGVRAPPNSPREALVATSVPVACWSSTGGEQQYHHANTAITELANGHHHQQQHRQYQDDSASERTPLDLAIKGTKRPAYQDEILHQQLKQDDRRKRRRVSELGVTDGSGHWSVQTQHAFKSRASSYSMGHPPREQHYYHQHQSTQLYSYMQQQQQHQESTLWASPGVVSPSGRRQSQHYQDFRTVTHEKSTEFKQISHADYALAVQRMHEETSPEQAKSRNPSVTIHKPIVQKIDVHVSKSQQHHEPATTKSGVVIVGEPRTMAEEFPTLGNFVLGINKQTSLDSKKDGPERTGPSIDGRQALYQTPTNAYKTTVPPAKALMTKPITGMWPPGIIAHQDLQHYQQQQQQRSYSQSRHQQGAYYPPIAAASGLSYLKYPKDPYQTLITRHYNPAAGYPYHPSMSSYRLSAEQLGIGHQTQRNPPLIPMDASEKRLPTQRYDPAPSANYSAEYARRVSLEQYPQVESQHQQQYAQILTATSQKLAAKAPTPELTNVPSQGRQYKNSNIYVHSVPTAVSRNGSVIGSTSSTPTSIYSNGTTSSHHSMLPPRPIQPPVSQTSPTISKSVLSYDNTHDFPTPNLREVINRPNTGAQSFRCSNCGSHGARFECLGCETTFYCNETCQTQHWGRHVDKCPKIMPRLKQVG